MNQHDQHDAHPTPTTPAEQREDREQLESRRFDPKGRRSFLVFMVVAGLLFAGALGWLLYQYFELKQHIRGEGINIASYGYDLDGFRGDRDLLIASGLSKDERVAIVNPDRAMFWSVEQVDQLNEERRHRWVRAIAANEPLIGVAIGDEARAYPLRFLNWHEIVNDTIAGVPVAVTWSPISSAAVVFDRRVGDEVLTFGYSGLFYNQNLVMYDVREADAGESLWSQIGMRAIAGPRAGQALRPIRFVWTTWSQWQADHPQTLVMHGIDTREMQKAYRDSPLAGRYRTGRAENPVRPLPPADAPLPQEAIVAAWPASGELAEPAFDPTGMRWHALPQPMLEASPMPETGALAYARWFAWFAFHGDRTQVMDNPALDQLKQSMEASASP